MTNGQHDELWMAAFKVIPEINMNLRRANALACAKELYNLGSLSKEGYEQLLIELLGKSGIGFEKKVEA